MRKRFYALFVLLMLASVGGFAQISSLSELSNTKAYTLTTARGSLGVSDGALVSTLKEGCTASNFALISSRGKYYLYSVAAKGFVNASGNVAADELAPLTIVELGSSKFQLRFGSNAINVSGAYAPGLVINTWTNKDDGNQYTITEAEDFDPTAALAVIENVMGTDITSLSALSNSKSYVVTNARGTWNVADGATAMSTLGFVQPSRISEQFGIISSDDMYFLYSINAGKFLTSDNTLSDVPQSVSITATGNADYPFFFSFDSSHNINVNGSGTVLIDTWSTIDAGNSNAIIEVADADLSAAVSAVNAYLHPANITYTVNFRSLADATLTVGGTAYREGDVIARSSALTASDITLNLPTGYALTNMDVSAEGDERAIIVDTHYTFPGKVALTDLGNLTATKGYVLNNVAGSGIMMAETEEVMSLRNLTASSHAVTSETYRYPYLPADKNHVWQILSENGKYYLYNPGQQRFAYLYDNSYYKLTAAKTPIYVNPVTTDAGTLAGFAFNSTTTDWKSACAATQNNPSPIRWWYSSDSDCQWEIVESDFTALPLTRDYVLTVAGLDDPSGFSFTVGGQSFAYGDKVVADILLEQSQIEIPAYTGFRSTVTLEGNVITITYIGEAVLDGLVSAVEAVGKYADLLGTGVGKYSLSNDKLTSLSTDLATAQNYLEAESVPYSQQAAVDALTESLNGYVADFTLNMPETGKYYRLKAPHEYSEQFPAESGNYYLSAEESGSTNLNSLSNVADATNIFYLTEDSKLLSYYNPTYLSGTLGHQYVVRLSAYDTEEAFTLGFSAGNQFASYNVAVSDQYYLYNWYYSWSGASLLMDEGKDNIRCQWYIEPVEELPLTLSQVEDAYYSTLYLPVAVKVSGATAYLPAVADGVIRLTEVADGVVPARTAVILKGTEPTATAAITTTDKTLTSALTGTIANRYTENVASPYVFSYRNGVLGFFRYVGSYLTGNKAYYVSGDANVEGFTIEWDHLTDGIGELPLLQEGSAVYDLSGRRLDNDRLLRGLYIQNGKKYIVK